MGTRIGKEVYWSGSVPTPGVSRLVIVVFGSCGGLVTSGELGSAKVKIEASPVMADRVVLPGIHVGYRFRLALNTRRILP